ncbi:Chromosome partition protein Smc [Phycisphaerae bacterium RAS1]|nr:Chromosome partition protein Smc [Phycisphaerae bacterium RAS1]
MAQAAVVGLDRIAALGRAAAESRRRSAADAGALDDVFRQTLARGGAPVSEAVRQELDVLLAPAGRAGAAQPAAPPPAESPAPSGSVQSLMRERAALELRVTTEKTRADELDRRLASELTERKQAEQVLSVQRSTLTEMQGERSKLLDDIGRLESQLRVQINEHEQLQVTYDKLKNARQSVNTQATQQADLINQLRDENEKLRAQVEAALRERDTKVEAAEVETVAAEGRTAEAAFKELWAKFHTELPEVFVETHTPTHQTFEEIGDALVELIRAFAVMEAHIHGMLRDLRQVGERTDKLNTVFINLSKMPKLVETLRDYLVTNARRGNFVNLLRAVQVWSRAFGSGCYKTLVVAPNLMREEMNPKSWAVPKAFTQSEDAALGKYYRDTAQKELPDKIGTLFKKKASDMVYEDYDQLFKRQK